MYFTNPNRIYLYVPLSGYCPPLQLIQNGRMAGGKKVGEKMWFICNHGYTMIGSNNIQCQLNATWSGHPPVCGTYVHVYVTLYMYSYVFV